MLGAPDTASDEDTAPATCTVAELGTCVQLTAAGELDLAAVPLLRAAAERVAPARGGLVVLDLCGATFVDGALVHFALGLDRRTAAQGGALVVVAGRRAKELFALVGADGITVVEDGARPVTTEAAS